ncbi:hypothetical protein K501DRAFT_265556 [Backusella circina FSU 941]|nr:hypothetical protein K501DRAFT_265556 [Backusella circina FSU 941]
MTLTPSSRRHTLANTFFFKPAKTDFEVYRDPDLSTTHKRCSSEKESNGDPPAYKIPAHKIPVYNTPVYKTPQSSLLDEYQNKLKQIRQRIKQIELEIACYRFKKQYEMEIKATLQSMNSNYKRLNDIDLDLTLLIAKLRDNK